jgi:hypothetical protein
MEKEEPVGVGWEVSLFVPVAVAVAGCALRVVGVPEMVVRTGVTVEAMPEGSMVIQGDRPASSVWCQYGVGSLGLWRMACLDV